MFKKAKRVNLRRRNESDEEEQEERQQQPLLAPTMFGPVVDIPFMGTSTAISTESNQSNGFLSNSVKFVKRDKKVKETATTQGPTVPSLLSFNDEEEGSEVFRVKKSTHSKKIVKQLKREYKEDLEKTTVKHEIKTDTPLISVFKEEASSRADSEQGEEEMEVDSAEDPEEDLKSGSLHSQVSKSNNPAGTFNTLSSLSTLKPGEIPDAAFIHAARKRRQLARELGVEAPQVENEGTNKRLLREEDQASDDEDDEKRIRFSGVKNKSQRQKIAEEIGIEGSDDEALDAGQDEEVSRWEQEQIRKGISIPQVQTAQPEDSTLYYQSGYESQPYSASYTMPFTYSAVTPQPVKPVGRTDNGTVHYVMPSAGLTPVSIDMVKKRLRDRLSQMHAGHEANVKRYKQIKEDLAVSESTIQEMEDSSNDKADQYKFLQEMRGYVRDLLECFSEKVRENLCSVRFAAFCFVPLWSFTTYIYLTIRTQSNPVIGRKKKKKLNMMDFFPLLRRYLNMRHICSA